MLCAVVNLHSCDGQEGHFENCERGMNCLDVRHQRTTADCIAGTTDQLLSGQPQSGVEIRLQVMSFLVPQPHTTVEDNSSVEMTSSLKVHPPIHSVKFESGPSSNPGSPRRFGVFQGPAPAPAHRRMPFSVDIAPEPSSSSPLSKSLESQLKVSYVKASLEFMKTPFKDYPKP